MLGSAVSKQGKIKSLWDCSSNDLPEVILIHSVSTLLMMA